MFYYILYAQLLLMSQDVTYTKHAISYYIIVAQLFLQPQHVPYRDLAVSYYMIDALLFLFRPQRVLYTENAFFLCCIHGAQLFLQPQHAPQETRMRLTLTNGVICREITLCLLYYMLDARLFLLPQTERCLLSYFRRLTLYSDLALTSQRTVV
jgi:hypothetical protein